MALDLLAEPGPAIAASTGGELPVFPRGGRPRRSPDFTHPTTSWPPGTRAGSSVPKSYERHPASRVQLGTAGGRGMRGLWALAIALLLAGGVPIPAQAAGNADLSMTVAGPGTADQTTFVTF